MDMMTAIEKAESAVLNHLENNPYDPGAASIKRVIDAAKDGRLIDMNGKDVKKPTARGTVNAQMQEFSVANRTTRNAVLDIFTAK